MKNLLLIILTASGLLSLVVQAAGPKDDSWEIVPLNKNSPIEYDNKTGTLTVTNGAYVSFRQGDIVLTADVISGRLQSGDVEARGHVTIKSQGHLWTGDSVGYNFHTRKMRAAVFKTARDPIFIAGHGLGAFNTNVVQTVTNTAYTATNAIITTDNTADPAFRIRAQRMTIIPDKLIEAHNATLYLGDVPVFWLPYIRRSLGRHPNNFEFTPGGSSQFGPYLYSTYNWWWSDDLSGAIHLDLYSKRGVGVGPDFNYDLGTAGKGMFRYYYINDQEPGLDPSGQPIQAGRQFIQFSHEATLRTNLTLKAGLNYQSDPYVIRDFFETDYRKNIQPSTFLELNQVWPNFTLDLLTQPRLNDFYEAVERLPDLKLTGLRQQMGVSPFYYESETSAGFYEHRFPYDTNAAFSAWRADTFHQITLPQTFFGWLNVTPRIGGRYTHYGETDGVGSTNGSEDRFVFNTGAEVTFKLSRVWSAARNETFDVTGLRHVIEPGFNFVYVPNPSVPPNQLPQFDYEVPGLRLLPIDYPDYNSIDAIDSQNVVRLSLRNRVQTHRRDLSENLLNWALYTDWRLDKKAGQSTFSDLFSDFDLRPRSWLVLSSHLRYGVASGTMMESNHRLTVQPGNVWSVSLGHRFLNDDVFGTPGSGDNSVFSSIYYRVNENWGFRMTQLYDLRDSRMQEQYYSLYRDLRSWTSALTFRVRENQNGPKDYTVAVQFSLKAFPRHRLGSDTDYPTYLLGR